MMIVLYIQDGILKRGHYRGPDNRRHVGDCSAGYTGESGTHWIERRRDAEGEGEGEICEEGIAQRAHSFLYITGCFA